VRPRSRFAVASLLTLIVLAMGAGSAAAIIPASSDITTPAGPLVLFRDFQAEGPAIVVSGTAASIAEVDIRCYHEAAASYLLASNVTVSEEAFSATVALSGFPRGAADCRLRAVPTGTAPTLPPGEETEFRGPIVAPSTLIVEPEAYDANANSLTALLSIEQAEGCGLESALYNATTKELTPFLFFCNGGLEDSIVGSVQATLAHIDGSVVYGPLEAGRIESERKKAIPGVPKITITSKSFDPSTGNMTITERDPWVRCAPEPNVAPTGTSCKEFAPTGVTLERSWKTSASDQVAAMLDSWQSTDAKPHEVAIDYLNELEEEGKAGVFEFPGTAAFAGTTPGQSIALPPGAGTILYKNNAATPDPGDATFPQGAIAYDRPPSAPLSVTRPTSEGGFDDYLAPYTLNVPAGGSSVLRMTFAEDFSLPVVKSEAEAAIAGFAPTISIATPANGTTIEAESASVAVAGSAADTGALSSVTVNGAAVTVGADGSWATSVVLKPGANTITATATDQAGLSKSASITVTYKIPPGKAAVVGKVTTSKGRVIFTLKCTGPAGSKCSVKDSLVTVERRNKSKVVGLLARIKKRTVTVASGAQSINAGKQLKVTLKLNATGRALLKRFHKLPVHLTVTVAAKPKARTVISKSLTVKTKH
jgi:hypothetical protein